MPVDPKVRYAFRNVVITLEDIQEKLAADGLTVYDNNDLAAEIRAAQRVDRGEYRERALRAESRLETIADQYESAVEEAHTRANEKEARVRQLEARVAELATESSANETAYLHECNKSAALEEEAHELRARVKELEARTS